MFPALLGRSARVESRCAATGAAIQLVVSPEEVSFVDPQQVAVSLVMPAAGGDFRQAFCAHVNFYATLELASQAGGDGAVAVTVDQAFRLGRGFARRLLAGERASQEIQ